MSNEQLSCPSCGSTRVVKNGKIHNGKQNHKCRECGRQFVLDPQNRPISDATKRLIDKLVVNQKSVWCVIKVMLSARLHGLSVLRPLQNS